MCWKELRRGLISEIVALSNENRLDKLGLNSPRGRGNLIDTYDSDWVLGG